MDIFTGKMGKLKYAKVRYVDDETEEIVSFDKIKEFKKKKPKEEDDYDKDQIFNVKYRDPKNNSKDHYYEAFIICLLSTLSLNDFITICYVYCPLFN